MADRLDAEVDEVGAPANFRIVNSTTDCAHDAADAERDGATTGRSAERVAQHAQQAAEATERQRAADREEHARPGDDDQDRRRDVKARRLSSGTTGSPSPAVGRRLLGLSAAAPRHSAAAPRHQRSRLRRNTCSMPSSSFTRSVSMYPSRS